MIKQSIEPELKEKIDKEGDGKDFIYKGFRCEIRRIPRSLHLCGYVYLKKHLIDSVDVLEVHGGITFNEISKYEQVQKIGFDCAHCCDLVPGMNYTYDCLYRDMEYVENEIKQLVDQIIRISGLEVYDV